jgi:hypothetical protein
MPLQGNIRDFSTTQLLNLVNLSRRTGMLTIFEAVPTGEKDAMKNEKMAAGSERAKVAFNKGKLVYASLSNQDNGLVAVLNKAGKLTDAQAKVLRDRAQGTSDKALAMRLIGAKYVTQQDIVNCIKNHILDVVYNLTTWSEGPFRFDDNTTPSGDNILVPIELENVIIESKICRVSIPLLKTSMSRCASRKIRKRNSRVSISAWMNGKSSLTSIPRILSGRL